jgi:hypothetical protein
MTKRWTVLRSGQLVTVTVAWGDGRSTATRADIEGWFDDHLGRPVLVEICKALAPVDGYRVTTSELVDRVVAAIERGDLRVERRPVNVPIAGAVVEEEKPAPPPERAAPVEEKTWIGIRLVDDGDPPRPIPFRRYKVELPDGSTREGTLDGDGVARITGIDPGQCQVTFPGVDARSLTRA